MVPDGWLETTVGRIAELQRGFDLPTARRVDGPFPIISSSGRSGFHAEARVKGPGIVTGRYGSIGEIFFVEEDYWPLNTALWVKNFHGNDRRFVYYLLQTVDFQKFSDKTGVPGVNRNDIHRIPSLLPPFAEQKKIAEILSTWDEAIETTEKLLANAEAQKRALMQQLLTGKRRLKGYGAREWQRYSLDAVFERVRRKNTVGNRNVLTISGKEGLVSQIKYFNKLVAAADTSGYTLLRGGEFAYNKSYSAGYPLGAIKMLPMEEEGVLSSLYICFRLLNKNRDCGDFYRHWFEFGGLNRELSVVAQEGARNHGLLNVGVSEFFKLLVSRPDAEEQREIAVLLNGAELQAHNVEHQLERLKLEKQALMQQLLTGNRRVTI